MIFGIIVVLALAFAWGWFASAAIENAVVGIIAAAVGGWLIGHYGWLYIVPLFGG